MTNMFQVCSNLHRARVFIIDTHLDEISPLSGFFAARAYHARGLEGVNQFNSDSRGDLHFQKPLPCGEIDFWQPPPRLLRGISLAVLITDD